MTTVFEVEGMMCNHCKATVEKACLAVPGVTTVDVDLKAKTATVSGEFDAKAVKEAIRAKNFAVKE